MDGLTLLERLGAGERRLSTVIVSAYGDMPNIRTAMNRGAFDFLTKPIDFADFETTVAKTLAHVWALRDARDRQAEAERAQAALALCPASGATLRRYSPTSPASPRSSRRSIPKFSPRCWVNT